VTYLIDTSALIRVTRGRADPRWNELVDRGLVAICDPVLTETLVIADATQYERVEQELTKTYPRVPVPDDVWEIVTSMRRELAKHSTHQALSVADYLVAATAVKRNLTVLHEDRDFETAARLIPTVRHQWITSAPVTDEP
jgi:predicted nucleic acid-binding protein